MFWSFYSISEVPFGIIGLEKGQFQIQNWLLNGIKQNHYDQIAIHVFNDNSLFCILLQ
jgi:hypothetical protein